MKFDMNSQSLTRTLMYTLFRVHWLQNIPGIVIQSKNIDCWKCGL